MTAPTPRPLIDPFNRDDPLSYDELDPAGRALRALLAVLAETGAAVVFPVDLLPQYVPVEVAAGWTLRPTFTPGPAPETVVLSAVRRRMPFTDDYRADLAGGQP